MTARATVAYSPSGVLQWTNHYNGPANGSDSGNFLAIVPDGVIVAGYSDSDHARSGGNDIVVIKYANIPPPAPGKFRDATYSVAGFQCTFSDASIGQSYRIQTASSLASTNWTDLTNFIYPGPVVIVDPAPSSITERYFRAVTP